MTDATGRAGAIAELRRKVLSHAELEDKLIYARYLGERGERFLAEATETDCYVLGLLDMLATLNFGTPEGSNRMPRLLQQLGGAIFNHTGMEEDVYWAALRNAMPQPELDALAQTLSSARVAAARSPAQGAKLPPPSTATLPGQASLPGPVGHTMQCDAAAREGNWQP
jgi:hypothetical protein